MVPRFGLRIGTVDALIDEPMVLARMLTVSLFVAALVPSGACNVRHDEFDCENAVSHLQQCCPGFDPSTFACKYSSHGCTTIEPDLGTDQSDCIRSQSCETLAKNGGCLEAQIHRSGTAFDYCPTLATTGGQDAQPPSALACQSAEDCAAGLVCCSTATLQTSACTTQPACASGIQLCRQDADCLPGMMCTWTKVGTRVCAAGESFPSSSGAPVRDDGSVGDAAMVEGDAVDGAADGATDGAPDETLAALPDAGAGDADGGP